MYYKSGGKSGCISFGIESEPLYSLLVLDMQQKLPKDAGV